LATFFAQFQIFFSAYLPQYSQKTGVNSL